MYQLMYAEDQTKFTQAVGNHLTYLKGKYKTHHAHFKQMGTGVNPEKPVTAVNLLYLDEIWTDNPVYAAKAFSSTSGTDHVGDLKSLTQPQSKEKGKGKAFLPLNSDDLMIINDNAPNTRDVEDKHIDSTEDHPPTNPLKDHSPTNPLEDHPPVNPPPNIKDHPPYDTMDTVIVDFTMELLSPSSSSHQQTTMLKDSGAKNLTLERILGWRSRVSAAASEYKITKVNTLRQKCDLDFQCEKAQLKHNKASIVHQCCQESKTLDLQVLKAQTKVHAEQKAALQLEIKLLKLKRGVAD
ncbi:uncharacterized protein F5147DRAFT_653926 [Suillus discolor]|uniref:Uncharacterized protein n=1 Tax=Suillus discolor TaxID=1912936 RepID=A0A9P7F584_9AGAM|nr:uncharacterized protein F5147DRAFT_653926 [Suillus discolor]KAG2106170.1 hypothetical protein F5147DRAFT_653926 [Suillus discolor]